MIETIERFLRYICGSLSCSCKSSCIDHCKHHDDKCSCSCFKKNKDIPQEKIVSKSLKANIK